MLSKRYVLKQETKTVGKLPLIMAKWKIGEIEEQNAPIGLAKSPEKSAAASAIKLTAPLMESAITERWTDLNIMFIFMDYDIMVHLKRTNLMVGVQQEKGERGVLWRGSSFC